MKQKAKNGKLNTIPLEVPNAPLNAVVQLSLTLRIKEVVQRGIKGVEGDLIILGLDPDPQCPCHPDVLDAIHDLWQSKAQNKDENRAVTDSYNRVKADFEDFG